MHSANQNLVRAALFDLDGTLVDTMPMHFAAYRQTFNELGIDIDFEFFLLVSGGPARDSIPRLLNGRVTSLTIPEIHRRKQILMNQILTDRAPERLPCALLMEAFASYMPIGLVSSGSRESVNDTLSALGWLKTFQVVISGDDVIAGKPAPDGYLRAASRLGVKPENCLVFEDMQSGAEAAQAAGMQLFDLRFALPTWRCELRDAEA